MSSNNNQERPCVVWPLIYFGAEWEHDLCDLGVGLCVVRARPSELSLMAESLESCSGIWRDARYAIDGGYALRDNVEWLLVNTFLVEHPQPVEELTLGHEGHVEYVPSLHPVHALLASNFLTALSIVKANEAITPVAFRAEAAPNGTIVRIGEPQERWDLGGDPYETHLGEPTTLFDEEELERLRKVLPPIAKLRNLQGWAEEMVSQRFSSFGKLQEEEARASTRLGRALLLFEDGIRLPGLHAFLSMWLVLETLYTDGHGEVIHKLATRLARILGGERFSEREQYFTAVKESYQARSDIVHGKDTGKQRHKKKIDAWSDAFRFARQSLERILCDKQLFDLFTQGDERIIRGFFKSLDLGEWEANPEP